MFLARKETNQGLVSAPSPTTLSRQKVVPMRPINTKESLDLLASLGDVIPFLAPAKAIVLLIAQALEEAEDNFNQCMYLLQRCTHICIRVDRLCKEGKVTKNSHHLIDFKQ